MRSIRIGCSGYLYPHWRGLFYPAGLPTSRWFQHYAQTFDTVELNNPFYRLPAAPTVEAWRDAAPRNFLYAWKASRYLTHLRKLTEPNQPLDLLWSRARLLGPGLGPVLYQLPPGWKANLQRLEAFLQALPANRQQVIEFRDSSWLRPEVEHLLTRYGVAQCIHDMPGSAPRRRPVGPFLYLRFHGASARYQGTYSDADLEDWADWLMAAPQRDLPLYAYFNNDIGGHAPQDALRLRRLLVPLHSEPNRPTATF